MFHTNFIAYCSASSIPSDVFPPFNTTDLLTGVGKRGLQGFPNIFPNCWGHVDDTGVFQEMVCKP